MRVAETFRDLSVIAVVAGLAVWMGHPESAAQRLGIGVTYTASVVLFVSCCVTGTGAGILIGLLLWAIALMNWHARYPDRK